MTTLYVLLDEGSDPLAIKDELAKHPAFPAVKTDSKGDLFSLAVATNQLM